MVYVHAYMCACAQYLSILTIDCFPSVYPALHNLPCVPCPN